MALASAVRPRPEPSRGNGVVATGTRSPRRARPNPSEDRVVAADALPPRGPIRTAPSQWEDPQDGHGVGRGSAGDGSRIAPMTRMPQGPTWRPPRHGWPDDRRRSSRGRQVRSSPPPGVACRLGWGCGSHGDVLMAIPVAVLMAMRRVEAIAEGGRRRRCDAQEKLRLVRGAFPPGAKVAQFARAEGVDASLPHRWRRPLRGAATERPSLAPLVVTGGGGPVDGGSSAAPMAAPAPGIVEVELACGARRGGARLRRAGPDRGGGRPGGDPGGRGGAARAPAMIALPLARGCGWRAASPT